MKHLNSYNNFDNVNENIFKKWFGTSDEDKKKWGYVKNDDGEWVAPDKKEVKRRAKKAKEEKVNERDKIEEVVNNLEPKGIENINYNSRNSNWSFITFDIKQENLNNYINGNYKGVEFEYSSDKNQKGKKYHIKDLISSAHCKVEPSFDEKNKLEYSRVSLTFKLNGKEFGEARKYSSSYEGDIRGKDDGYYLTLRNIEYRSENQSLEDYFNMIPRNLLRVTDFWRMTSLFKESFEKREEDLMDELIKNSLPYVIECFYDLSDLSDEHEIKEERGEIIAMFKIPEIEVNTQSESKYVGRYRSRASVSFHEAHFRLNEMTSKVFGILSEIRPRVEDKIDGCRFDVVMKDGKIKIIIS